MALVDRFKHAWNAFMNKDPNIKDYGASYYYRPDRMRYSRGNERSIVNAVYSRIALDAAACTIQHVRLDENNRFLEEMDTTLNTCLTLEANRDQTGRALIQDLIMSMFDEGCIAVIPVDTEDDPIYNTSFDVLSLRVGRIVEWYPKHIKVNVYDENSGQKKDLIWPKDSALIIENPFYTIMNEPNSTAQRLIRKLNLLDAIDEQSSSGKMDLIIQLPYLVKTASKRQQAETRRKDIERQLTNSKYGIAYVDGTEHITQLNRPVENNLMGQIEYLVNMFYGQLGITPEIMNGTADEKTMNNYYNRTIEPILSAIVDEMKRKFLTQTARSQGQSILFFMDPFKLVATTELSDLADKFTRNEIVTPNEFRQIVGMKPSKDPKADELRNRNISMSNEQEQMDVDGNVIKEGITESEEE